MKVHLLSDLHNEFQPYAVDRQTVDSDADVVVLAGDIGVGDEAIHWIAYNMPKGVPVIFVPGNHEYYRGDLVKTLDNMRIAVDEYNHLGYQIFLLHNQAVNVGDVQFFGATLWTDYALTGNVPLAMFDAESRMNDYRVITRNGNRIGAQTLLEEHNLSREALMDAVYTGAKTVVVTHHAPCELSVHPRYRSEGHLNASYASRLDYLFQDNVPLWVHGHTHDSFDYTVGSTRVVCNPRGYAPNAVNPNFDGKLIIEV